MQRLTYEEADTMLSKELAPIIVASWERGEQSYNDIEYLLATRLLGYLCDSDADLEPDGTDA